MIVNKLRTKARFTVGFICTAIMVLFVLTVKTSAFSGRVFNESSENNDHQTENSISAEDNTAESLIYMAGPVNVTLVDHGVISKYEFFPVDCAAFLQYEGIELGENDIINISPDTVLYDNIIVDIGSVEYVTETRVEKIPFETIEFESKTIPKGTTEVITPGVEGEARRSYIVKYVNGAPVEEAMYSETVLSLPTEQTVSRGVGGTVTAEDGTVYNYSYYIPMEATAYTYIPGITTTTTATGRSLQKGIAAVDPDTVPLHTKMFVTGSVEYGYCEAEDTGGAIVGNKIDLAYPTYDECIQFGRRNVVVYILE